MPPTILITGATGGLGAGILHHLSLHLPKSSLCASSSRPEAASQFENAGFNFRVADYSDPASLRTAFRGIEKLLFVSSNTFDNATRTSQHRNVIEAAKETGVGHVYYTSLAWGGFSNDSRIDVQQAHLWTEKILKESGVPHTNVRMGVYAEAFPLFLNYYPSSTVLRLPADGPIALASRAELAEATARLMVLAPGAHSDDNDIVLLTGPRAVTLKQLVERINTVTKRNIIIEKVSFGDYVKVSAKGDEGGKGEWFFEKRISWYQGVEKGDGATVSTAMENLLGRAPKDGCEVVEQLLKEDPKYTWHQLYVKKP